MTANVLEHRRARAFADAVEDRPGTDAVQQFPELLTMVESLGSLPEPVLAAEVRTVQRAQLMAEFERAFAGGGGVPAQRERGSHRAGPVPGRCRPSGRWGRKLAVSGLAAGVVVSAFGGVAAASSSALPGDALYGVKRGLENWRLDFAGSEAQRGKLLLGEASQRMSEARKLVAEQPDQQTLSPHVAAEVTKALSDMNAEGTQGRNLLQAIYQQSHSLAPLRSLATFDSSQQRQLDDLAPHLPSQADPMAGRVQQLLSGISAELAPLHLAPAATGGAALPGAGAGPSAGTVSGTGSSTVGTDGSGTPRGATSSGTGSMSSGAPGSSPTPDSGGALGGLGGLLNGDGGDGGSPSSTPSAGSKPAATPSASTPAGNGLTVPPLVPGLLPTLGIALSGGGS